MYTLNKTDVEASLKQAIRLLRGELDRMIDSLNEGYAPGSEDIVTCQAQGVARLITQLNTLRQIERQHQPA